MPSCSSAYPGLPTAPAIHARGASRHSMVLRGDGWHRHSAALLPSCATGSRQTRDAERFPDHPRAEHGHRAACCRPRSAPGTAGRARGTVDRAGTEVGESAASRQCRLLPTSPTATTGASHVLLPSALRWTDADGRCLPLLLPGQAEAGTYKLRFETAAYWQSLGYSSFYPFVEVLWAEHGVWGAARSQLCSEQELQGPGCCVHACRSSQPSTMLLLHCQHCMQKCPGYR